MWLLGEGHGTPLQCSCLENPRDGGAWWGAVYGVTQSRTRLKGLSMLLLPSSFTHLFMHVLIHWSIFLNAIGSGKSADLSIQIPRFSPSWPRTPRQIALPRFPHHFKNNIRTPAGYREALLRISADALGSVRVP